MKRKILYEFILGVILSVIGLISGLIIDIAIGRVGYEATGYLGAIMVCTIGMLLGIFLISKLSNNN